MTNIEKVRETCPFCGGTNIAPVSKGINHMFRCQYCRTKGPTKPSLIEAASAWNYRYPALIPTPQPKAVAAAAAFFTEENESELYADGTKIGGKALTHIETLIRAAQQPRKNCEWGKTQKDGCSDCLVNCDLVQDGSIKQADPYPVGVDENEARTDWHKKFDAEAVGKIKALRDRAEREFEDAARSDNEFRELAWRSMRDAYEKCLAILNSGGKS